MNNINDTYFDGYYKEIWKAMIPSILTTREVDFMCQYFNLNANSKVLDLMCGYGRHALALAEKGVQVIAVDNLDEYIDEIKTAVVQNNLPVQALKADVKLFHSNDRFDLAICMGNSFNFFSPEEADQLLLRIHAHLKEGGALLINSWSLAEIAIREFMEKSEGTMNNLKMVTESSYLFHPTRIESQTTIISPDGGHEIKTAIDYIFSVAEMEALLHKTGFKLREVYSIPGKKKFTLGEPRAYIVADRL